MRETRLLSGVEDTLYIPLFARIYASERFPDFFYDEKALSLKPYIPADGLEQSANEYFSMASVCRQKTIDGGIVSFLNENEQANVVFLGAGLETAYHRIGNSTAHFYQVDLPDVIAVRSKVLGCAGNETLVAGDMFALAWMKEMDLSLPTLLVVSGVYQYFEEAKIVDMIQNMKSAIPKGELLFDATNSKGLKLANKYVRKTGNPDARMYFSVDNPQKLAELTHTKLAGLSGFYGEALERCKGLRLLTRIYMYLADKMQRTMVIHLKLN